MLTDIRWTGMVEIPMLLQTDISKNRHAWTDIPVVSDYLYGSLYVQGKVNRVKCIRYGYAG